MMRAARNTGRDTVASAAVALAAAAMLSAAALAEAGRSVLIVLDASGSMNQPMPEGRTRFEAAKAAVGDFLGKLPADVRLGLRLYGHQSSPDRVNCEDSELVAGFASVGEAKVAILAKVAEIRARGYTPITYAWARCHDAPDRVVGEIEHALDHVPLDRVQNPEPSALRHEVVDVFFVYRSLKARTHPQ